MLSRDFDPMAAVQKSHQETAISEIRRQHLVRAGRHNRQTTDALGGGGAWLRQGLRQLLTRRVSCTFSPATC